MKIYIYNLYIENELSLNFSIKTIFSILFWPYNEITTSLNSNTIINQQAELLKGLSR